MAEPPLSQPRIAGGSDSATSSTIGRYPNPNDRASFTAASYRRLASATSPAPSRASRYISSS
jgi:hypothetical protein